MSEGTRMHRQSLGVCWRCALPILLLTACSSAEPFDPAGVNLEGDWLLSDITVPRGGTAPGGITNECRLTDVPLTIVPMPNEGEWFAQQEPGGTIACEVDGVWGEPTPPTTQPQFLITVNGADVTWVAMSRYLLYTGKLTSANRMAGEVNPVDYGRQGTWVARRR